MRPSICYIGENSLDGQADFVLYHAVVDNVFSQEARITIISIIGLIEAKTNMFQVQLWCHMSGAWGDVPFSQQVKDRGLEMHTINGKNKDYPASQVPMKPTKESYKPMAGC